ncbi:uncharacterized protein LOC122505784 [Leptopilina heterotoma]|uniref:uncharacterized protein LOC122505784 n=1 Tax=Leptopilina heterotoma TaxID=63436 RepID=UPI001CA8144E|nr:uncharacterized protein LOC122505784 [Leptopilina heterotoma]
MTRDTHVIGIIETNTNKEPSPIGFLSSYLPSSSKNITIERNENFSPPYPINAASNGLFPIPIIPRGTNSNDNLTNVKRNEILVLPSAPIIFNPNDEKERKNYEKQEIENEISKLKIQMLNKSDEEKSIFLNSQYEVLQKIDSIKFRLSPEEKNDFQKKMKEIDDIRMLNTEMKSLHQFYEEIDTKDSNDEAIKKCSFDISSLLPKFPQLVIDIVICVKGAMQGLMNVSGATFFIISLSASLFTAYFLLLFCTCRRTKKIRISEFLHSLMYTILFLIVSIFSNADEQLRAFGFLASVPYGSEISGCWPFIQRRILYLQRIFYFVLLLTFSYPVVSTIIL